MLFKLAGKLILFKELQPENASIPIVVILFPENVILVIPVLAKALSAIPVALSGITTSVALPV